MFWLLFQVGAGENELEIDVMYEGANVPSTEKEEVVLEDAPNAPGFVHVFTQPLFEQYTHQILQELFAEYAKVMTAYLPQTDCKEIWEQGKGLPVV